MSVVKLQLYSVILLGLLYIYKTFAWAYLYIIGLHIYAVHLSAFTMYTGNGKMYDTIRYAILTCAQKPT